VQFIRPVKVVLLRQYRAVIKSWLYEFPAGTIEPEEKTLACAQREIIEGNSYRRDIIQKLGCIYPVLEYFTELIPMFTAERLTAVGMACEEHEVAGSNPAFPTRHNSLRYTPSRDSIRWAAVRFMRLSVWFIIGACAVFLCLPDHFWQIITTGGNNFRK